MSARTSLPDSAAGKWQTVCSTAKTLPPQTDDFAVANRSPIGNEAEKVMSRPGKVAGDCRTAPWQRQFPPCVLEPESSDSFPPGTDVGEGQQ